MHARYRLDLGCAALRMDLTMTASLRARHVCVGRGIPRRLASLRHSVNYSLNRFSGKASSSAAGRSNAVGARAANDLDAERGRERSMSKHLRTARLCNRAAFRENGAMARSPELALDSVQLLDLRRVAPQ